LRWGFLIGKEMLMNCLSWLRRPHLLRRGRTSLLLLALAAGCGRHNEIRVYTIPKEHDSEAAWKLPAGWEQREAGAMRAARFAVPNTNGQAADVSIIPLKNITASRADVVNLWREQIRLAPLDDESLAGQAEKVAMSTRAAELFDMVSAEPITEDQGKVRTLIAWVTQDTTTWFVKMTGDDEHVRREKPAFVSFLQSLNLDAINSSPPAPRAFGANERQVPGGRTETKPDWSLPAGWKEIPAPQMLLAKFRISGTNGASADVNVSVERGDGGGLLNNVNRWRNQLGLAPVEETDLQKLVAALDLPDGKAMLVDMNGTDARTGQPTRLIGAMVPRDKQGHTWFYKLMGNPQLAEQEKAAFVSFLQSAKYPNG
jgi:hypothetical protein